MGAYYNEIDPFSAQWLRNLMKAGVICDGEVDERSIEDVKPVDLKGFTQHHFFAGIGVWSYALRRAGWSDDRPVWTGSCPCQPFSSAGKGEGFDDERHLWPAWHHLLRIYRPNTIFGEQIANGDGLQWLDLVSSDLEGEEYAIGTTDLSVAGFGGPGLRQRLFFVSDNERSIRQRAESGGLAHADYAKWRTDSAGRNFRNGPAARWFKSDRDASERSPAVGLADITCNGRRQGLANACRDSERDTEEGGDFGSALGSDAGGLGDAERGGHQGGCVEPPEPGAIESAAQRETSGLGDSIRARLAVGSLGPDERGAIRVEGSTVGPTSALHGPWRGADWLYCTDGLWRPVEPGTFPLASGAPVRVGRLRAYGNAINAEVAENFIRAYLDEEWDAFDV